jgi:hypothetical protein
VSRSLSPDAARWAPTLPAGPQPVGWAPTCRRIIPIIRGHDSGPTPDLPGLLADPAGTPGVGEPGFHAQEERERERWKAGVIGSGPWPAREDRAACPLVVALIWGHVTAGARSPGRAERWSRRAADLAPLIRPGDALLCDVAFGPGPVRVPDLHFVGDRCGSRSRADALLGFGGARFDQSPS